MCLLSKNIDRIGVEFEEENNTCFLSKKVSEVETEKKFLEHAPEISFHDGCFWIVFPTSFIIPSPFTIYVTETNICVCSFH